MSEKEKLQQVVDMLSDKDLKRFYFLKGKCEMAWELAVWKNGTPVVGVMETPYKKFVGPWIQEMFPLAESLGLTQEMTGILEPRP